MEEQENTLDPSKDKQLEDEVGITENTSRPEAVQSLTVELEDLEDLATHSGDESLPHAGANYEVIEEEMEMETQIEEKEIIKPTAGRPKSRKSEMSLADGEPLSYELQQGYRILCELMGDANKAFNYAFLDAVDDSHPDTSDYYEIVDNPMWLRRMKEKFDKRLYDSITQFVSDFRVMVENCYRYNGPDHFISKRGQRLELMMEQKLALLSRELREKTSVAATSGDKVEETFSSAMRRRVKSTYQRDTPALLTQLRQEEAQRDKELRRQQILDRKAANEALIQEQIEWEDKLLAEPIKTQMNKLWELPQIGHFLFLCQELLNVGEVPQFELERGFAMAKRSSCIQAVMTTLLSTPYQRTHLGKTGLMPYSVWNNKLKLKLTTWYKHLADCHGNTYKAANKLGIDSFFFDVVGTKNPLERKMYDDLSYYRKIWIVKSLCDHCLETQESIRDAIERQPIPEQKEYLIGYDTKSNLYIHFPQFCGADLRIYRQEPFPEPESDDEEEKSSPKKIKLETPKKSTPVNSIRPNSNLQTPDSANRRRSRRGQSEESTYSNNNSSVKSSGSKLNFNNHDDTSNDSTSLPLLFTSRRTRSLARTPLFLDETSNDSASLSITNSPRKKKGGKRKSSGRLAKNLNDTESVTESEYMDESTCSSLTECAIDDRLSEDRESVKSCNSKTESVETVENTLNKSNVGDDSDKIPNLSSDSKVSAKESSKLKTLQENNSPKTKKGKQSNSRNDAKTNQNDNCDENSSEKCDSIETDKKCVQDQEQQLKLDNGILQSNENSDCDVPLSAKNSETECSSVSKAPTNVCKDKNESSGFNFSNFKTNSVSQFNDAGDSSLQPCNIDTKSNNTLDDSEKMSLSSRPTICNSMNNLKNSSEISENLEKNNQNCETDDKSECNGKNVSTNLLEKGKVIQSLEIIDSEIVTQNKLDANTSGDNLNRTVDNKTNADVSMNSAILLGKGDNQVTEADAECEIKTGTEKDNLTSDEVNNAKGKGEASHLKTELNAIKVSLSSGLNKINSTENVKQEIKLDTDEVPSDKITNATQLKPKVIVEIKKETTAEENSAIQGEATLMETDDAKPEVKTEIKTEPVEEQASKKEGETTAMETNEIKTEVKEELVEEEEESEEELEPELGSFQMICDNVDDLRKLVDKFAEQEPVVVKRGNKEKIIYPPARKKCIVELHERLAFLLSELEPWESKLNAAMRKARVKVRREYEEYVEEPLQETKKWESESESRTNTDCSDDESDTEEVEVKPVVPVKKPEPKAPVVKQEIAEVPDDEIDVSSRGRLRKRRVIPNNIEESILKKKKIVIKKEEPLTPTHVPNILHRQTPVACGGSAAGQSLTLQPTSAGHTIAIRPTLPDQPQSASQLLRLVSNQKTDVTNPNVRPALSTVSLVKQSAHPVIQQLLSKQTPQPSVVTPSLVNPPKAKPGQPQAQSRIQYVIQPNQPAQSSSASSSSTPNKVMQVTNISSLPAGLLQQLIKNQVVKLHKTPTGETQLILAAPLQVTATKKQEHNTSSGNSAPLVITPISAAAVVKPSRAPSVPVGTPATVVGASAKPPGAPAAATVDNFPPANISKSTEMPSVAAEVSVNTSTIIPPTPSVVSVTVTSPNKPPVSTGVKYATNVTVRTLLDNRALKKLEASSEDATKSSTGSDTTRSESDPSLSQTDNQLENVSANLKLDLKDSEHVITPVSSISTSLPTVNIKIPPPVTLPVIQPRKNITRTVQMFNAPISVTSKSESPAVLSSSISSSKPMTNLVKSVAGQTVMPHHSIVTKPGMVIQTKPPENKTILLPGQNKTGVLPQNLVSGSPNFFQGILTPQGLQIPTSLISSSTGSFILQSPTAGVSTSSATNLTFSTLQSTPQSSNAGIQFVQPGQVTTLASASGTPNQVIRQPAANYFILQPQAGAAGKAGQVQQVQLQKLAGGQNQLLLGSGQRLALASPSLQTTMATASPAIQLKSPNSGQQVIQTILSTSKPSPGFVISPNVAQGNTSTTMQASNIVRQLAADQQKVRLPVGQKPVGLQILGNQQQFTPIQQNMVGMQGILPSGQVVHFQTNPNTLGAKPGNASQIPQISQVTMPTIQTVQLPQGVVAVKSPALQGVAGNRIIAQPSPVSANIAGLPAPGAQTQTVLLSPSNQNHSVRLQSLSQQILQSLQGQRPVRPRQTFPDFIPVPPPPVQFHFKVKGNKVGLTPKKVAEPVQTPVQTPSVPPQSLQKPSSQFVVKPTIVPTTLTSPNKGAAPSTLQMPLNITIPSSVPLMPPSPRSQTPVNALNVTPNVLLSPKIVTPQKSPLSVIVPSLGTSQVPTQTRIDPSKLISPSKLVTGGNAAQFASPSPSDAVNFKITKSGNSTPEKANLPDTKILDQSGAKPITESPGKQKLLLYNVGGQLMTAQGIPVTVDQGVLKIVPQANIQIGSQTITVRAPGQSPNDSAQTPTPVAANTSPGSSTENSGLTKTTDASKVHATLNLQSDNSKMISTSSFPYSFSSKALITAVKASAPTLSTQLQSPVTTVKVPATSPSSSSQGTGALNSNKVQEPERKPKLEIKYELSTTESLAVNPESTSVTINLATNNKCESSELNSQPDGKQKTVVLNKVFRQNSTVPSQNVYQENSSVVSLQKDQTGNSNVPRYSRLVEQLKGQSDNSVNQSEQFGNSLNQSGQSGNSVNQSEQSVTSVNQSGQSIKSEDQSVTNGTCDNLVSDSLNSVQSPEKEAAKNLLALAMSFQP